MGNVAGNLIHKDTDLDDLDLNVIRYKPTCLDVLIKKTNFTRRELQIMYRGFKQECPSGIVNEATFKEIYAQFFPQGDASMYAHYVFHSFDTDENGTLTFEQFVDALSMLSRGKTEDKLGWIFRLYDLNRDGVISRAEMTEIVSAIYDLLGRHTEPYIDDKTPREHVDHVFQKMDLNRDGVISIDEFMSACYKNPSIFASMEVLNTVLCFD